jgi:hypothetical protein
MPKKKSVGPPPRKIMKTHFFKHPAQQQFEETVQNVQGTSENAAETFPQREKRRFFVYDKETGEPFAEWINNVAISLETGEELFRSRRSTEEQYVFEDGRPSGFFDFSVPTFYRADDPAIYTEDLIQCGILSEQDIIDGKAGLTQEKYIAWKQIKIAWKQIKSD